MEPPRDDIESTEFDRFRSMPPLDRPPPPTPFRPYSLSILDITVKRSFSETPVELLKWILLIELIISVVFKCATTGHLASKSMLLFNVVFSRVKDNSPAVRKTIKDGGVFCAEVAVVFLSELRA